MVELGIRLLNFKLRNPLIVASGPLTKDGRATIKRSRLDVGAVVMKSVTVKPREGYPHPQIIKVGESLLNAQGLPNIGYEKFVEEIKLAKRESEVPLFASLVGSDPQEYVKMAKAMEEAGADALELPLISYRADDYSLTAELISVVKGTVRIPVIAKLWYDYNVGTIAQAVESAGADAITVMDSVPAMLIDVSSGKPRLGSPSGMGGLTGFCIKPLAIRSVAEVASVVEIPVIGCGGVKTGLDAVEMMMAGARAVELLTAPMQGGGAVFNNIVGEMRAFMEKRGYKRPEEFIGASLKHIRRGVLFR